MCLFFSLGASKILKLNVTWIGQPSALTAIIPIWAMTMTKFGHYQLEVKVNKYQMTQLFLVPTSPLSHAQKGFIGVRLSYELNNMHPTNMNMACCFWLRLQAIQTSFKGGYIIRGGKISKGGV
jgi:hypothetical protein